ncbi:hydroxymethylglutaryl-CoA synthase [Glonium stellatum]|uniref:Hydroxymethylglutaryl-CoA synthase n=1 Tax=Glonium stellatum TaxID=574774 RepID=A0A8E2EW26_9PEZI|nr:hydroxymethylglutaryl-CoA synthase [Glonium stellatum]
MLRPRDVGIKALELYTPNWYVDQEALEKHDGIPSGKYTIGLGQKQMSFCDDREDIYSLALTAVSSLLKKYALAPSSIGRLEVGTETLLDKSKSVKSVLMQLFAPYGNTDIEGVDAVNACYGGTNALFNAVNWVESSSWDGRDAIVVAGDIAIYDYGPARPTGGAGIVAMLVGPNAPLVIETGCRGSYMQHAYDFYKPNMASEYPVVHGQYSIECYTRALDACYKAYVTRSSRVNVNAGAHAKNGVRGAPPSMSILETFDYVCFHTPSCKLALKSYGRLLYNDYLANPSRKLFKSVPDNISLVSYEESLKSRDIEKIFVALAKTAIDQRVLPTLLASVSCGNMYTASVYGCLSSLISNVPSGELCGKRIAMFSYGSGLASTLFSIRVVGSTAEICEKLDLKARLDARHMMTPVQYEEASLNRRSHALALREAAHLQKSFTPRGEVDGLARGTYYLEQVDEYFRRFYGVKE